MAFFFFFRAVGRVLLQRFRKQGFLFYFEPSKLESLSHSLLKSNFIRQL